MRERPIVSRALSQLNLHIVIVAVFLLADIVLGTRLLIAWHRSGSDQTAEYTQDLATYARLQSQSAMLDHLPEALAHSDREAGTFFASRIEPSDSAMLSDLGQLVTKDHVHWSRATYAPRPTVPGIVEFRVEASVAGEYTDVMRFINDLERDKDHAFFIIRSVVLSGAQGGAVDLRLRLDTYLRADASGALLPAPNGAQESQ